ncbi:MAG: SAM-dependent chlorinase/fluorinase [Verrucomicrobia bacterium]|nr:SAM-dependent chlorinase/fluorinase [Verrucomicrobiota bacterium]
MSPRIITLLTDFGSEDYFVGAMKGTILTRSPKSVLVDITHTIPPQDVRAAAFTLNGAYPYFPAGSIHLAVVDPGVGSERRPVLVQAAAHLFVGPDNGLFTLILEEITEARIRHLTNTAYFPLHRSSTFHGRDIFAPVAAALAEGVPPENFGPTIRDPVRLEIARGESMADGSIAGMIIHVDHFGTCVTNLACNQLSSFTSTCPFCLEVKEFQIRKLARCYDEGAMQPGEPFLVCGSAGMLEISVWSSSAARELKIKVGEPVLLVRA